MKDGSEASKDEQADSSSENNVGDGALFVIGLHGPCNVIAHFLQDSEVAKVANQKCYAENCKTSKVGAAGSASERVLFFWARRGRKRMTCPSEPSWLVMSIVGIESEQAGESKHVPMNFKSRLVALGNQEKRELRSDSPTADAEGIHLVFSFASSRKAKVMCGDLESAYFTGERTTQGVAPRSPSLLSVTWRPGVLTGFLGMSSAVICIAGEPYINTHTHTAVWCGSWHEQASFVRCSKFLASHTDGALRRRSSTPDGMQQG